MKCKKCKHRFEQIEDSPVSVEYLARKMFDNNTQDIRTTLQYARNCVIKGERNDRKRTQPVITASKILLKKICGMKSENSEIYNEVFKLDEALKELNKK